MGVQLDRRIKRAVRGPINEARRRDRPRPLSRSRCLRGRRTSAARTSYPSRLPATPAPASRSSSWATATLCPSRRSFERTSIRSPQHPLEHRALPQLSQLLQCLRRRDCLAALGHRLRSRNSRAPDDAVAPAVRWRLHQHQRSWADGGAASRSPSSRKYAERATPSPSQIPDHRQQQHLRRHRRTLCDDDGRERPQPAHHAARARSLARRASRRIHLHAPAASLEAATTAANRPRFT